MLNKVGFNNVQTIDVTDNIAEVSVKWHNAREKRKKDLLKIEEEINFEGLQSFFSTVHVLSSQRRLSRFMYAAVK